MTTSQNAQSDILGKRHTHGFRTGRVLVRSFRTEHNIHPRMDRGTSTDVSCGGAVAATPVGGFRITITESRVQPTTRTQEPFNADVSRVPSSLEAVLVPLTDRSQEIELPTIAEVKPSVWHGISLLQ